LSPAPPFHTSFVNFRFPSGTCRASFPVTASFPLVDLHEFRGYFFSLSHKFSSFSLQARIRSFFLFLEPSLPPCPSTSPSFILFSPNSSHPRSTLLFFFHPALLPSTVFVPCIAAFLFFFGVSAPRFTRGSVLYLFPSSFLATVSPRSPFPLNPFPPLSQIAISPFRLGRLHVYPKGQSSSLFSLGSATYAALCTPPVISPFQLHVLADVPYSSPHSHLRCILWMRKAVPPHFHQASRVSLFRFVPPAFQLAAHFGPPIFLFYPGDISLR